MPDNEESYLAGYKRAIRTPRTLYILAAGVAMGAAGLGIWWKTTLAPTRAIADKRYECHLGLMRLYDLQTDYKAAHGTYANDIETLLAGAADAEQIKAKLAASTDMNTLTVVGDADRFRLEANVLDGERTLVKIRGPLGRR